jgi:hypothetical protein
MSKQRRRSAAHSPLTNGSMGADVVVVVVVLVMTQLTPLMSQQ